MKYDITYEEAQVDAPEGTTDICIDNYFTHEKSDGYAKVEYYKEVGVSKEGYPTYVRWIASRSSWAKVPQAVEHVPKYGRKVA